MPLTLESREAASSSFTEAVVVDVQIGFGRMVDIAFRMVAAYLIAVLLLGLLVGLPVLAIVLILTKGTPAP